MSAPRVFFLVTEDWYFVSHRLALAKAARAAGFEVAVITRAGRDRPRIEAAGIAVIPFEMDRRGLNPLALLHEVLLLARIYRREKPDIVHHVALRPVVVGGLAAWLAGVSRVVSAITGMGFLFTDGGRGGLLRKGLTWLLARLLQKGLTIVQNRTDWCEVAACGVPGDRLRLIPGSGVDVSRYVPVERPPNDPPVVMLASRMLWDKGVGEFVEAARKLKGCARFVLVGATDTGNPTAIPEGLLRRWQSDGLVEWWGRQDDMPAVFNAADIVCLPSYREGLPKVLLEAMACGKPCITTDVPGCRDAVRHGENGLLVPMKDAKALSEAIEWLLSHPQQRARMGSQGCERALREFSEKQVIGATLAVYRELLR